MARKLDRLTALQAQRLGVGRYPDGGNLYLHVTEDGRYWFFRWDVDRRPRYMNLGPVHSLTLKQARDRAKELRAQRLAGHDPKVQREAQRAATKIAAGHSFANVVELYLAGHEAQWAKRTAHELRGLLKRHALPLLGDLPVSTIETPAILQTLQPIWHTRTTTASRLRGHLEAILDYAKVGGFRSGENPARWRGHLANSLPAPGKIAPIKNYAALPYSEIADSIQKLHQRPEMSARALEFAILTASRISTVLHATWGEISAGLRTAPAAHMKTRKVHRAPLSTAALAVLEQLPERESAPPEQLVFTTSEPGRPIHKNRIVELGRTAYHRQTGAALFATVAAGPAVN
jgi:integrase